MPPFHVPGFAKVDASDSHGLIAYLDMCTRISSRRKRASYMEQRIAPGMVVLDAGCGTGDDVRALAEIVGPAGRVVGIDASLAMIAEAQKRGLPENAEARCASVDALPFADATFDACRAERVFQHLRHPEAAARELRRVLKSGGSIIAIDQDWETMTVAGADESATRRILDAFIGNLADGRAGRHHAAILERAGFRDVRVRSEVTTAPLGAAYALVLNSAIECAKATGTITAAEADTWVSSLLSANRQGAFRYEVSMFTTLAYA